MTTHPVQCSAVLAAMKQTGMDYKAIASKTHISEKQVEQLCTGLQQATPEQHDAISKALGITSAADNSDSSAQICLARPLHGDHNRIARSGGIAHHHHDIIDATGLVRHARARRAAALKAGVILESHPGLNPPGEFTWLRLKNVVKYNEDSSRFDFAFDDPNVISEPLVSSTCVVCAPPEKPLFEDPDTQPICPPDYGEEQEGPNPVYRAYTPITARGSAGILSLTIKKQPDGKMSNYVHALEIGERLGIMGYLQRIPSMIPWPLGQYDAVTLVAGGVGITPLVQVLEYSLQDPNNKTKFLLLNGNSTENDIVMRPELDEFQKKYPGNFQVVNTLSRPPEGWTGETGRIDAAFLQKWAPPPVDDLSLSVIVCVSGPPAFLDGIAGPREGDKYNGFTGQGRAEGCAQRDWIHRSTGP
ncbi:ferredoxin reductase-like protein [Gymnopus androsaceus JB14]|uniref:cytochrome-b5 reductase n=1 Tax=Gymnopus androsaceus JB14 TaxID=1447944 RepID=A0A6A4I096_9AGAR|nr:ferredoxin reductase-like protein [Gymnopus androsaceus JB14]